MICFEKAFLGFLGGGDVWGNILWFVVFIVFMLFYPRIMIAQILYKLESSARMIEGLTKKGKNIISRKVSKKGGRKVKERIGSFLDFFMIQPVSLDPYGVIKKLEHIANMSDDRFRYFVNQISPKMDTESKQNVVMGLSATVQLNQIAKIVRHYVELVRKTKNLQLSMVLQMQLPLIERLSKALLNGAEALTNGWPIGDSIGCMVAANLIGKSKTRKVEKDTILASKKMAGRKVFIIKAKGPGGRLGKLGKATEKLVKKKKIAKIITIDASAKLEGERTGKVVEGVGVAIGGLGVDRSYIENVAVKGKIPLDSIVVKMSQEEAIQPIKSEVLTSMDRVVKVVEDRIKATKRKGAILIIGVGNTSGVGNNSRGAQESEKLARKIIKVVKKREQKEKERNKGILKKLFWGG
jgi:hypothetical protein